MAKKCEEHVGCMQNVRALSIARYGVGSELHGPYGYGYFCAALVAAAVREFTLMLFLDLGVIFEMFTIKFALILSLSWFEFQKQGIPH
jgi:hypothetical protein